MDRRTFLATGATLPIAVGTSGCLGGDDRDPVENVRFTRIGYLNADPEPYDLHVLVVDDGDPVYWRSEAIPPAEPDDDGGYVSREGEFDGYPTDPGPYAFYARLDDRPKSEWASIDVRDRDVRSGDRDSVCVGPLVEIRDGELSIWEDVECPDEDG